MPEFEWAGNAAETTLAGDISAIATTLDIVDTTGWPTGTGTKVFLLIIDRDGPAEEKILCESRSSGTITVATGGRGYDGTTATSHGAGEKVEHVVGGVVIQAFQDHVDGVGTGLHTAADISYAGSANLVATDVEAALDELDVEKLALAGGTMSGELILADNLLTRPVLKDYAEQVNAYGPVSGTLALNLDTANVWTFTLAGAVTFSDITGEVAGKSHSLTLVLTQDATGSRTVTWPAAVKWAGGTAPTLSTAAGAVDIITLLTVDGGTTWYGFVGGKAFA